MHVDMINFNVYHVCFMEIEGEGLYSDLPRFSIEAQELSVYWFASELSAEFRKYRYAYIESTALICIYEFCSLYQRYHGQSCSKETSSGIRPGSGGSGPRGGARVTCQLWKFTQQQLGME